MSDASGSYEVGYKKPPKHTRFQKGHSGNPGGLRKKPDPTVMTAVDDALAETIDLPMDGNTRSFTAKELIVAQLMAKSMKGDLRAIKRLLDLREHVEKVGDPEPTVIYISEDEAKAA